MSVVPPTDRHISYQLQYRKCGKWPCRCHQGQGHGPYWYGYWYENGKYHCCYIGKKPPEKGSIISSEQKLKKQQPIHVHVYVDSREIASFLVDRSKRKDKPK